MCYKELNLVSKMDGDDMLENMPSTSAFALAHEKSEAAVANDLMVFDVDNADLEAGAIDQPSPEFLQRKLYFLLEHLKKMHGELPE